MGSILLKNVQMVNEGTIQNADVLIADEKITKIAGTISQGADREINAEGLHLLPGLIDDQVHFREPGLTHKAEIATESKAALAGGITSFMEMPNTKPQALTQELLEQKYHRAQEVSRANYSFFMGTSNNNLDEVLKTDPKNVCGVKIFMGSSTGNMLVDDLKALEKLFQNVPLLIATHCEDESMIRSNTAQFEKQYGENIPFDQHPIIRSREACLKSSSFAVELAKKFGSRLHVLHISTLEELELFETKRDVTQKKITAEACVHHLWFSDEDYERLGARIKWNPAVKTKEDREALWQALAEHRIDVIATDHAPHTLEEKQNPYLNCPSGGPLVQYSLPMMLEQHLAGRITLEALVEKMCHNPARLFRIPNRGFIREGYQADLVLVNLKKPFTVQKEDLLYKCKWSPLEGQRFRAQVITTLLNGEVAFENGQVNDAIRGQRLVFEP